MKTLPLCVLAIAIAISLAAPPLSAADSPSPTTWRGTLQDGAAAANGLYDIEVHLHGQRDGSKALTGAIQFPGVRVSNGSFELPLELAPWLQAQPELWLELAIKGQGDSGFVTLPDRAAVKAGAATCWNTDGNANLGAGSFLGTIDSPGLVLKVLNRRVAWYSYFFGQTESPSIIMGDEGNLTFARGSVIAGGGADGLSNIGFGNYGTISGGNNNHTGENNVSSGGATVSGGLSNRATATTSVVGGGNANRANARSSTVSGGQFNQVTGNNGAIGGGTNNEVTGSNGTIGGGEGNLAGNGVTIGGGTSNAAIGGGATIGGGDLNVADATYATVPGGNSNRATGIGSFAAGQRAQAMHFGSFVWNDGSSGSAFSSTRPFQMRLRAAGGVHVQGEDSLGVNAAALGNSDPIELVLEAADAQAYLMSDNVGGFGSVLALGEMSNNALVNTWGIARETSSGGNGLRFTFGTNEVAATNTVRVKFNSNGTVFKSSGTASWDVVSDARLKTELGPVEHALDRLLQLRGIRFAYHDDAKPYGMDLPKGEQTGFIAQEVQRVFPDWVNTSDDGTLTIGERGTTALMVEALRELSVRNAVLEAQLLERDAALEARIAALEQAAEHER